MKRGALVVLAVLALAGSAEGHLIVEDALTTPATRVDVATKEILYYLRMQTGPQAERFSVRLTPPRLAREGPFDEGEAIDGPQAIALQGAGTIGAQFQATRIIRPCTTRDERFNGFATGATDVDVALPAASLSTLAVRYLVTNRAPWFDSDYRLSFAVRDALVGTYDASSVFAGGPTGVTPMTKRTTGPKPGGRLGAHLLLSTTPRATATAGAAPRRISPRTRVTISGRLLPQARGRTVVVEWSRPGGSMHTVARLKTGGDGRFRVRGWRPPVSGTIELWARYPTQPGGIAADQTSCPLRFSRAG